MASGVDVSWVWAVGFIAFAFGIACGIAVAYLIAGPGRRTRELQDKCDTLQQEFDGYRDQVGQHFLKTAELVQKMTDSYRDVYEHLASGSESLCKEPVDTPKLDIPSHPTLASASDDAEPSGRNKPEKVHEADTDEPDYSDSDAFLGDSPRIPTLDMESEEGGAVSATRRRPSP
jgi:uncharacterized membrane-anchored protein YhcB (DUF1043 family)